MSATFRKSTSSGLTPIRASGAVTPPATEPIPAPITPPITRSLSVSSAAPTPEAPPSPAPNAAPLPTPRNALPLRSQFAADNPAFVKPSGNPPAICPAIETTGASSQSLDNSSFDNSRAILRASLYDKSLNAEAIPAPIMSWASSAKPKVMPCFACLPKRINWSASVFSRLVAIICFPTITTVNHFLARLRINSYLSLRLRIWLCRTILFL